MIDVQGVVLGEGGFIAWALKLGVRSAALHGSIWPQTMLRKRDLKGNLVVCQNR